MRKNTITLQSTCHSDVDSLKDHLIDHFVDCSTDLNLQTCGNFKTVISVDVHMNGDDLIVLNKYNRADVNLESLFDIKF